MRVAVVHEFSAGYAGSERVLEQILALFPQADLFMLVDFVPPGQRAFLGDKKPQTTFIQRFPFAKYYFRKLLPLMPMAIEELDLREYDLVLSSSHCVAKGGLKGPHAIHICYCHTPMRYAWDFQREYLGDSGSWLARYALHRLRQWDYISAQRVDHFIANSDYVAERIRRIYQRDAHVIYPPVDVERFAFQSQKQDFYVTISRLVGYKKIPLIVDAFSRFLADRKLIVIGDGPDFKASRKLAGKNVEVLGYQDDAARIWHLQNARAFVFAAEEDFGIAPVEAQACGTPVIAFGKGGATETIVGEETGTFFAEQTPEAIAAAVRRFEAMTISPQACRENSLRFSIENFRANYSAFVGPFIAGKEAASHGPGQKTAPQP